jgi:hypothetical protein
MKAKILVLGCAITILLCCGCDGGYCDSPPPTRPEFLMVIKFTNPDYKNHVLVENAILSRYQCSYVRLHYDCDLDLLKQGKNYIELHDNYLLVYPYNICYYNYGGDRYKFSAVLNKTWDELNRYSFRQKDLLDEEPLTTCPILLYYGSIRYLNTLIPEENMDSLSPKIPLQNLYYSCDMSEADKAYRDSLCSIYVRILNNAIDKDSIALPWMPVD